MSEHDYDAIESAVVETARGRWFLAEYARRNRHADTQMLIAALDRIEAVMRGGDGGASVERMRFDLLEMAKAIARTRSEIAAIRPNTQHHGKFVEASAELDSIVQTAEAATSDILAAAEQIQEIAWTLREQGLDSAVCDRLDGKATDIYTACSFQDLAGQRTEKVTRALAYLEERINGLIGDGASPIDEGESNTPDSGARGGLALAQTDIDAVMAPTSQVPAPQVSMPPVPPPAEETALVADRVELAPRHVEAPSLPSATPSLSPTAHLQAAAGSPPLTPVDDAIAIASPGELGPMSRAMAGVSDPLAAVSALSYEEKIALFT